MNISKSREAPDTSHDTPPTHTGVTSLISCLPPTLEFGMKQLPTRQLSGDLTLDLNSLSHGITW